MTKCIECLAFEQAAAAVGPTLSVSLKRVAGYNLERNSNIWTSSGVLDEDSDKG